MSQILTVNSVPPQPGGALWKKESFSLEGYKTNNVKVRFQINTDEAVLWWGWAIDEIKIAEPEFANDIKPYSIDSPVKNSVLLQGNSFIPSGSIRNIGNSTQTNISVTYKIYNTLFDNNDSVYVPNTVVYSQSTSVASLPAGQVANVEYLSTSLNSPGFYYAVLLTSVPGDQNTANDSLSSPFNIGAIISGTYYVGGTNPTPDFATFADAMNYLNTSVVGGNTTFILNKTLFSEQGSRMQATYLYPDSGHTVILKPGPGMNVTMNFLGTPEKNYGISVQNSNNIIIDGSNDGTDSKNLTVQVNDLGGVITTALQVINCTNSDFKNITLKGYRNNSIGIGSVLTLTSSGNAVNKNILLNNLRIYKGNYGIFALGNSSSKRDTNIVISNCVVGGQGDIDALLNTGIYMNNIDMADVHHNEVNGVKRNEGFGSADVYGIHANTRFSRFYNNNIHNIWYARNNIGDTASGFLVMGMRVNGRTAGFDSKNHVFNNFIYDLRSDFAVFNSQKIFGLRVSRGKSDTVSHNTVLLTGRNVNQDTTAAFVLDSTSVYNVNNIFYNGRQDSTIGYSFAIWKRATTANSSFLLSNNNVLYAPSPSGYAGGKGNGLSMLAYRTLTNWQTNQSPNVDTNSVYGDPVLIKTDSLANLHVADSTKSWAESRGIAMSNVLTDIDGDLRNPGTPDAGADEFSGHTYPNYDMEVLSIDNPRSNGTKLQNVPFQPIATFHNTGSKSLTNVAFRFKYLEPGGSEFINPFQGDTIIPIVGVNDYITIAFRNVTLSVPGNYQALAETDLALDENIDNNNKNISFTVGTPLAGTKTVGPGGRYASLTDAVYDLRSAGMNGPVTLELLPNPGPEKTTSLFIESPVLIDTSIAGIGVVNTLTIKPSAGVSAVIQVNSTPTEPYGIRINKVSGVTIDGSNTVGGSTKDLTIQANGSSAKFGVWVSGGGYGTGGSAVTKPAKYNTIKNLIVRNGASGVTDITRFYGVYMIGRADISGAARDSFNTVSNCDIASFGQAGILVRQNASPIIEKNEIHDYTYSGSAIINISAIWDSTNVTDAVIRNNRIHDIFNSFNGGSVNGIENGAGSNSKAQIYNNMIWNVLANASGSTGNMSRGIYGSNAGNSQDKYYHNTVHLTGLNQANSMSSTNRAMAMEINGVGVDVRNNILVNAITHSGDADAGKSYAIYLGLANNFSGDYNVFYAPGTKGYVGYNSTAKRTLTDWSGAFATAVDTNSVHADPMFMSATDLHINTAIASVAENWCVPVGSITQDIDGNSRGSSPDAGADEFSGIPAVQKDFAATSVDDPVLGRLKRGGSLFVPKGKITNSGSKKQNGVLVQMEFKNLDNINVTVLTSTNVNLPSYTTSQISFPAVSLPEAGTYVVQIKTLLESDVDNANDTTSMSFQTLLGLHGTLTVGSGNTNYKSLGGILDTLSQVGVDQPLEILLVNNSYNEVAPVIIDNIQGTSAVNTVMFHSGNGGQVTISAPGTSNTPSAIKLNGCSYVILDSLHIVSTGNDGKYGVMITGVSGRAASNNTIQNCTIENIATTTGFNSGLYGIYLKGYSSSLKDLNNTIKKNTLSTFGQAAIRIENASGTVVEANKIGNWIQTGGGNDIKGIWVSSNANNTTVRGNIIYGITSLVNGTSVTGIEDSVGTANSNFLCYNNMIYGLGSNGGGGSGNRVRGIFIAGANQTGDGIYNNSIYLSGNDNSIASVSYATGFEAVTSGASAFSLKNNIFYNTTLHGSSNARSYGIRLASTTVPTANISSNNNLFYIPTNDEQPQGFIGRYTSVDKLTLNDWRTATNGDANSKTGDPRYLSSSDLHIATTLPKSPAAASGTSIAEVTTDIDGDSRLNPPDIGADEFSVVSNISGKVQEDADGLMSTTNDRTALVGWKVYLNLNGNIVTTTTDNSGNYSFGSLSDGSYTVTDSLHATYAPLDVSLGSGANSASRVDSSQVLVDVSDGDDALNYNLINYRPSTITARVWEDGDGNFATSNDWSAKNWRVNIYRVSQNPVTLVNSVDTSTLANATLGAGTYAVVIADSSAPAWVHIGKKVGATSFSGNYKADTITIAAASTQTIDFVNYLPHTIAIRVVDDADGSFSFSQLDTVGKAWSVNLVSLTGAPVNLSVSNDSNLVNTYLHEGTYLVSQADSTQNENRLWTHLGIIRDGVRERNIGINSDTVIVSRGQSKSIIFVNSRIYPDTTRYRTFLPTPSDIGVAKAITLKAKKGVYAVPNVANVIYSAYDRAYPKGTAMIIGVQMLGFEKTKLWAEYTKNKSFAKAFSSEHTGAGGPFVIPTNGKKAPLKDPKFDAVKFNNKLVANLIALKLNMAASDEDIVVDVKDELQYKFGDLLYKGLENNYVDMSLREIALLADTMLTKSENYTSDLYTSITNVLVDANKAFNDPRPLTVADTAAGYGQPTYGPKTFIRIKGTITVDESNPAYFVRDVAPPPRNFSASTAVKLPNVYTLEQNYPNPFNPTTTIEFYLPEDAFVTMKVYNVLGQEVASVLNKEFYEAGNDLVEFDASKLSSGVYFYRLTAKGIDSETDFSSVKKMILMK
jgi:hypothetical protein